MPKRLQQNFLYHRIGLGIIKLFSLIDWRVGWLERGFNFLCAVYHSM